MPTRPLVVVVLSHKDAIGFQFRLDMPHQIPKDKNLVIDADRSLWTIRTDTESNLQAFGEFYRPRQVPLQIGVPIGPKREEPAFAENILTVLDGEDSAQLKKFKEWLERRVKTEVDRIDQMIRNNHQNEQNRKDIARMASR